MLCSTGTDRKNVSATKISASVTERARHTYLIFSSLCPSFTATAALAAGSSASRACVQSFERALAAGEGPLCTFKCPRPSVRQPVQSIIGHTSVPWRCRATSSGSPPPLEQVRLTPLEVAAELSDAVDALAERVAGGQPQPRRLVFQLQAGRVGSLVDLLAGHVPVSVVVLRLKGVAEALRVELGALQEALLQLQDDFSVVTVVERERRIRAVKADS